MIGTLATVVAGGGAIARVVQVPELLVLEADETFDAANLSPAEKQQIEVELGTQSFDYPDSWDAEMRVRRVSLGHNEEGLILQGTNLLCGATGNCQTFVLRQTDGQWVNLFERNSPNVAAFALLPSENRGVQDLLVTSNLSAESTRYTVYRFTGAFYRPNACRETQVAAASINCE